MYITASIAALQFVGGLYAAQNVKATAKLNKRIADMNAEFAELDAHDAIKDGYSKEAEYQKIIDQTLSTQQAALTAADVDVNYGSVSTIKDDTEFTGEVNKLAIEQQAQEKAMGYERQSRDYRRAGQAGIDQANSKASQITFQSTLGAVATGARAAEKGGLTGYKGLTREDLQLEKDFLSYA